MYRQPYDLIFSLGDDCACSYYLREFKLQNASYPLDWTGWAPINVPVNLIVNDFKDFLAIEHFEILTYPNEATADKSHHFNLNKKTGLHFGHDFPSNMTLEEGLPEVAEKYGRRITRFYQDIEKAKKILFVWMSKTSEIDSETLLWEHRRLADKFPGKTINWLILENNSKMKPLEFKETVISPHITQIVFDNASYDVSIPSSDWKGNKENIEAVFSQLTLKQSKTILLKRALFRIAKYILVLIPFKKPRKALRDKIKVMLLGD